MDNKLKALTEILPHLEEMIQHELSKHDALNNMTLHALSIREKKDDKAADNAFLNAGRHTLAAHCKLCTLPGGDTILRCEPGPCPSF